MQTHNEKKLLHSIVNSALIIFGVLLLVLGISGLSRPAEAALCRSTPSCNGWEVSNYGCQYGGCSCELCCYYELGVCNEYPNQNAYFQRCNLGDCHLE